MEERVWHSLEVSDVLSSVGSRGEGLTEVEASRRLEQYGANHLPPGKKTSAIIRFLKQFDNMLIYVLLSSAAITAMMKHWVDSGVIFGVVFINAVIGFIQEGKAEKAMEAIRSILTFDASVLRGGRRTTIPADEIVPGDIVLVESGDKIPADMRLTRVKELRVEEAILTGESVPVEKMIAPLKTETLLAERLNMIFAGTFVTSGQAAGVVVATGGRTEIGRISEMVSKVETLQTPLLKKIAHFAKQLTVAILSVAVIVFFYGVFVKAQPVKDMFLAAVGLAVAAIPEGLPAIVTITLAIGVHRMAKRNAIIRRLPAVETLGSVTVICSDKTGTLTRNEMTVTAVITADGMFEATGVGYDPKGDFFCGDKKCDPKDFPILNEIAVAGVLCNDSSLRQEQGQWRISGDPTEAALMVLGAKCGIDQQLLSERQARLDIIPFESKHRFMATLNQDGERRRTIYVKGAPETLLEKCKWQRSGESEKPLDKLYWQKCIDEIAASGRRSLALAVKYVREDQQTLDFVQVGELTFLGMCGIIDPPRDEAIKAVQQCQEAGIKVKMITGDHRLTAKAIGHQMGIGDSEDALSGEQLEHADKETLLQYAKAVDIFGRVSPEHKLILVQALQSQGQIVAMTGDGVNDAPALKQANVGIAMGIKGTEVAKEASEMVLADDNFASIANAVAEGRTVYDNIRKSILFILPTNAAQALVIVIAVFLGYTLPITPVQILWVNMVTAVTLALSLAFEPAEHDVMRRSPRPPQEPILSGFLIWRVIFVAVIIVAGTFGLFLWELSRDTHIEAARTIAVNMLIMFQVFYLVNSRYLIRSVLSKEGVFGNGYVLVTMGLIVILQLLFTYLPPMQHLFGTYPLRWAEWLRIIAIAPSMFVIVEIEKAFFRLKQ